jgi:excisionase family DNA binding protein
VRTISIPDPDDELLRPREVAALFGVRPTTIARWAREGKLDPLYTPGGHRRYSRASLRGLLGQETPEQTAERMIAEDAARLYDQGWNVRQVAQRFGTSYGVMRRILRGQTTLRTRGGRPPGRGDR